MEETGIVIELIADLALVEFNRTGACKHGCEGCGACLTGDKRISVEASNSLGAKVGEEVVVALPGSSFAIATLLMYVLPLIAFLAALFLSSKLNNDLIQGLIAVLSAAIVFAVLHVLERCFKRSNIFTPRIVSIRTRI